MYFVRLGPKVQLPTEIYIVNLYLGIAMPKLVRDLSEFLL
jgi:hypothetical protein